jgi:hypothetical protein
MLAENDDDDDEEGDKHGGGSHLQTKVYYVSHQYYSLM